MIYHVTEKDNLEDVMTNGLMSAHDRGVDADKYSNRHMDVWPDAAEFVDVDYHAVCFYLDIEDAELHEGLLDDPIILVIDEEYLDLVNHPEGKNIVYTTSIVEPEMIEVVR